MPSKSKSRSKPKSKSKSKARKSGATKADAADDDEAPDDDGEDTPIGERSWKDRRDAVDAMLDELRSHPSAQRIRSIAALLLDRSEDDKWEVRHAVARAIAYLEHPDYATIAARLDTDDNSYVAKAARASAAKRRELDLAYQAKTDEIDEVDVELRKLRETHGDKVAIAAERIAEHKYRLLANETTHEMRTVVASLLDALGKLDASLEQSNTSKTVYERTLRIARERATFLQLMLDDTKKLVDEPKLEREDVGVGALLEKVAELVRGALEIPEEVRFDVEVGVAPGTSIHVPRGRLTQALTSLAKNAIEAVEDEGRVTLSATTPRRGWVKIAVTDTGYGMDAEEILSTYYTTLKYEKTKDGWRIPYNWENMKNAKPTHDLIDAKTGKVVHEGGKKLSARQAKKLAEGG